MDEHNGDKDMLLKDKQLYGIRSDLHVEIDACGCWFLFGSCLDQHVRTVVDGTCLGHSCTGVRGEGLGTSHPRKTGAFRSSGMVKRHTGRAARVDCMDFVKFVPMGGATRLDGSGWVESLTSGWRFHRADVAKQSETNTRRRLRACDGAETVCGCAILRCTTFVHGERALFLHGSCLLCTILGAHHCLWFRIHTCSTVSRRLHDRIKNLEEQLELRDQHYAQQIKTKELQMQLISTRLRQQTEIFEQDEFRVLPSCSCPDVTQYFNVFACVVHASVCLRLPSSAGVGFSILLNA